MGTNKGRQSAISTAPTFFTGLLIALTILVAPQSLVAAEYGPIFVPKNIVYPGQRLTEDMLTEKRALLRYLASVNVVTNLDQVNNLVARTTLVPNRPIPLSQLEEPSVVKAGKTVRMHYRQNGLHITTDVVPLESAKAGEVIRVRNIRTGVIISGIATNQGSVLAEFE